VKLESSNKDQGIFVFQLDKNNYIKFCPNRGGVITNWVSEGNEIFISMKKDLWTRQKVLGEVFQFCFQYVEISIPLVQYLDMIIAITTTWFR